MCISVFHCSSSAWLTHMKLDIALDGFPTYAGHMVLNFDEI